METLKTCCNQVERLTGGGNALHEGDLGGAGGGVDARSTEPGEEAATIPNEDGEDPEIVCFRLQSWNPHAVLIFCTQRCYLLLGLHS